MTHVVIGIITAILVILPMVLAALYVIKEERDWKQGK